MNIDSEFTRQYLAGLSENIRVLMHPNYVLIPFMWSHHEKMVIIDQKIGFIGGMDIAYGRMDSNKHLLTD
jgi:phospholipase D1/2